MKHVGQEIDATSRICIHFRRFMQIIHDSLKSVSYLVVSKCHIMCECEIWRITRPVIFLLYGFTKTALICWYV
jgi:hypothetical protein